MLFLVPMFLFVACGDENEDVESLTIVINNAEGGYDIVSCDDGDFMASSSNGELESTFLLPADKSQGICYQIIFDYVEGFLAPDPEKTRLVAGNPVEIKADYEAVEYSEKLVVTTNIPDGSFVVRRCSDNVPVGMGPNVPEQGDQDMSFILPAQTENGACYKVYFGDVPDYTTPDPAAVHLVAGNPERADGNYIPDQ
jgi:hypothetical protein